MNWKLLKTINFPQFGGMHSNTPARTMANPICFKKRPKWKDEKKNSSKKFPARTGKIKRLIIDSAQRNNYPDHDCVHGQCGPRPPLYIIGECILPSTLSMHYYVEGWPLSGDLWVLSTFKVLTDWYSLMRDVSWAPEVRRLAPDGRLRPSDAGAGAILLHNSGLV